MAKLIFKLKDVPLDEAQDVRELLADNDIAFYETHAGNWGIAMAGIWINDDRQYQQAMQLIEEYQIHRSKQFQEERMQLHYSGQIPTLLSSLRESPLRFVVYIFSIAVILYVSVIPFMGV